MRSVRDEFRDLVDTFEPKSREYWQKVGAALLGLVPENHVATASDLANTFQRDVRPFLGWLVRQSIPLIPSLWFARKINSAIQTTKHDYEIPEHAAHCMELSVADLKEAHKLEIGRHEQFVRKAQSYLMAIAVGVAFGVGMLNLTARLYAKDGTPLALKVVFAVVVLSLFMAAIGSLRVIAPSEAWDLWLQERLPAAEDEVHKKQLLKITLLNQGRNLIAASHVSASYIAMRNGVYLVLVLLLWAIVVA